MKKSSILISFIAVFSFVNFAYGQYYIYETYSPNKQFFLKSFPYDNGSTSDKKTVVYKADSTVLYEIPREFKMYKNSEEIFLSNDGQTIVYIFGGNIFKGSIDIFKNGKIFKEYTNDDLIPCDTNVRGKEDCSLFYSFFDIVENYGLDTVILKQNITDFEKQLTKIPHCYYTNDTLILFCKTGVVMRLDLASGNIQKDSIVSYNAEMLAKMGSFHFKSYLFTHPYYSYTIKLANGSDLITSLADFLKMRIYFDEYKYIQYKEYPVYIGIMLDSLGNVYVDSLRCGKDIDKEKIKTFFTANKFETTHLPESVDKWKFTYMFSLMDKNERKARRNRQKEVSESIKFRKQMAVADTIKGYYIPLNLEDCFTELDKLLSEEDKNTFKNLDSSDEMALYHLDFGRCLRNTWGLWSDSRLASYFNQLEIYHPDNMSGIILENYYNYLNGRKTNLDEKIQYYKTYWEKVNEENKEEFSYYRVGDTVFFNYKFGFITQEQKEKYEKHACIAKGLILKSDPEELNIRIKLLDACDKQGIVYHAGRAVIKCMKKGNKKWWSYHYWEKRD